MKMYIKYILIYVWWNFLIRKNEFSFKLCSFLILSNKFEVMVARREIAHYLDMSYKIKDIPSSYISNFRILLLDFIPNKKIAYELDWKCLYWKSEIKNLMRKIRRSK